MSFLLHSEQKIRMFSFFVYRLQITAKPNPAEKEPPSEVKAHIKLCPPNCFPWTPVCHYKQRGITTPLFCTHVKMFFLSKVLKEGQRGFLEMALKAPLLPRESKEDEDADTAHQERGKGQINKADNIHLFLKDSGQRRCL